MTSLRNRARRGLGFECLEARTLLAATLVPLQTVTPVPQEIIVPEGLSVCFDVNYSTDPQDETLTGLGLRMHYDSSQLGFDGVTNVLTAGLVYPASVTADLADFDGDANTDKYAMLGWADIAGNWPGALPQRLYTACFTVQAAATGSTAVHFTGSAAAGWQFASTGVSLRFQKHPWQNPDLSNDVDANQQIEPLDVLLLINDINSREARALPVPAIPPDAPPPYLDPSGDDLIDPLDVLIVINYINAHVSGSIAGLPPEGEDVSPRNLTDNLGWDADRLVGSDSQLAPAIPAVSSASAIRPQAVARPFAVIGGSAEREADDLFAAWAWKGIWMEGVDELALLRDFNF